MKTETYWPQQKVYLYANFALFPDKFSRRPISSIELNNYIPFYFESEEQVETLEEFSQNKMLTFVENKDASGNSEYVIDNIDHGKFSTYLLEYLEKFVNGELIPDSSRRPEPFSESEARLMGYLSSSTRQEPIVNPMNIWHDWTLLDESRYPFLEVILVSDLISGYVKILDFGKSDTLQSSGEVLYAELAKTEKFTEYNVDDGSTLYPVAITLDNTDPKNLKLVLKIDSRDYILSESLRTDLAPYSLMHYLLGHRAKNVTLKYAMDRIDGCESVKDLSEVIRQCGLDKPLKAILFDRCTKNEVQLKESAYITKSQILKLLK